MKVSSVSQMRNLDHQAIERYGIIEDLLMENAGHAVYDMIHSFFPSLRTQRFAIFCGLGNNGGDGLVVARKLHSNGAWVEIFLLGDPGRYKGSARRNYEIAQKLSLPITPLSDISQASEALIRCDGVVDAMLGTGLSRPLSGLYLDAVRAVNHAEKPVFSVDIPSGIHGDTGKVMGEAVRARATATFGLPKWGNLLYPGFDYGGNLFVTHISFPPELYENETLQGETGIPENLPPRDHDSHKGDYGKVLFIAGAAHYLGAPQFAALSFLKAGGGLAYLATPKTIAPFLGSRARELVIHPLWETDTGSLSLKNRQGLLALCEGMDMVVMGPGVSLHPETQDLMRALAEEIPCPLLIDGDGITALASAPDLLGKRTAPTILTPHPGEMARLTGQERTEIKENRVEILRDTTAALNAIMVLKGAHSLVGFPDGRIWINLTGNPGMATAGSGDVLTGTISAMIGRGLPIEEAVKTGVFLHGLAGDLAAKRFGENGLVAGDLMASLPMALKTFQEKHDFLLSTYYDKIRVI